MLDTLGECHEIAQRSGCWVEEKMSSRVENEVGKQYGAKNQRCWEPELLKITFQTQFIWW